MITSSLSPASSTAAVRSSSTHGLSSELTRVHSVALGSSDLAMLTSPARAASLRSAGTPSSRLPSRTSAFWAMSGTFAAIFSLLGSKKWIIRDGVAGTSSSGCGAPLARGFRKSRGLRTGEAPVQEIAPDRRHPGCSQTPIRHPCRLRIPDPRYQQETAMSETTNHVDTDQDARGLRRAQLRPLPRGVRGGRRLQALAGEDRHRGRRPPLLPADDEPPPAPHQRRLRGGSRSRAET